ncbi:hypothetical protein DFP72DRAFT_942469 [Ephemerocybe angulata]|uniref:Uncharacterized protein n=1 Tax=Ephemerocybe angulata TaxID=980116 RepID=A0A8H6H820_9AGAR|nr:hypothetical protein DFP72DRAFT_942469 [Tulosesus angulatus]
MPSAAASVAPTRAPTPVPSTAAPTPAILPNAFAGELDVLTAMTSPLEAAVNGEAAAPTAIPVAVKNPLDSAKLSGISRFLQAPPPPIPTSAPAPGSFTGVIDPLLDGPSAPALDPLSGCLSTPSTSTAVLQPWEEIHVTGQRNRAYKPKAFGTQGFAYQEYFGAEWAKGRTGATRGGFVDAWNALPAEAKKGYYDTWLIADSQKKARKTKKGAN